MTTHDLTDLRPLTTTGRDDCRARALRRVVRLAGPKPDRARFQDHAGRAYPRYIVRTVTAIMLVLLAAFFSISAMRLYSIGSHTFGETIAHHSAALVAGVAVVIGSEAGALGFLLAAGVLARDRRERAALYGLALASTLIALVGNVQFALGAGWRGMLLSNPFAALEAVLPPVVVLGAGLVFERLWLTDIERHHANERAYIAALAEWSAITAAPENHPSYPALLQEEMWQKLVSYRSNQAFADASPEFKRLAVQRELAALDWTSDLNPTRPGAAPVHTDNGRRNLAGEKVT